MANALRCFDDPDNCGAPMKNDCQADCYTQAREKWSIPLAYVLMDKEWTPQMPRENYDILFLGNVIRVTMN
jgi:hypothetical protein